MVVSEKALKRSSRKRAALFVQHGRERADGALEMSDEVFWAIKRATRKGGLGDLVAGVFQPIARALDALFATKLAACAACKRRRVALNGLGARLLSRKR